MIRDKSFITSMTNIEKRAWQAFVGVVKNFLGNRKAGNYMEIVNSLLPSFELLCCNISIKILFLFIHLVKFPVMSMTRRNNASTKTLRFLMWVILENSENQYFYLHDLTSFDCKIYVYLIMLFFCLMWSFCTLFLARKSKLILNILLIFEIYLFQHTRYCIVIK